MRSNRENTKPTTAECIWDALTAYVDEQQIRQTIR